MKTLLLRYLGATIVKGRPESSIGGQAIKHGHLPDLWDQLALVATGRGGAVITRLLSTPNRFAGWDIADRYLDGSHINAATATAHVSAAKEIVAMQQAAGVLGTLP